MYECFSIFLHVINSVFSGIYTGEFLKNKHNKKATILLWIILYFTAQIVVFEVIDDGYLFNDVTKVVINILLLFTMQSVFYYKDTARQLFVCFSFMAGKETVKYIASVLVSVIGNVLNNIVYNLATEGKLAMGAQIEIAMDIVFCTTMIMSELVYGLILGSYLLFINKKYVRKEYKLQTHENIFLVFPSITALCISITIKMMIISVENGITSMIYYTVPETMFWIPVICIMLLGAIIANVILFQNVVQYHDENRKRAVLENQILQMQKEVREIQDIYSDMRGLRHDLRGHISNITQYVKRYDDENNEELNKYIRNMEETVNRLDFGYQSGNPITDIIIHQKKQEADRKGINFVVDFNYPKELQVDAYDIGVVLNNALENAIEAASLVETDKYISLHSYVKGNLFFIEVENSFARDIAINKESGLPESSKTDKTAHGMGILNIRRCARKYMGDIDIAIDTSQYSKRIFSLTVMLNGKPAGL